jgi:hypothetical protein
VTSLSRSVKPLRMRRHAAIIFSLLLTTCALADLPAEHPWPEVTCELVKQSDPPEEIHTVVIDLSDHQPLVRVCPGGDDPDGKGKWQTTLMSVRQVAQREDFDIAINGDFFSARNTIDIEGRASAYFPGVWALVVGPAMTDGKTWSKSASPRPCLVITDEGLAHIQQLSAPPRGARQVVGGNVLLVAYGKAVPSTSPTRHPRTCVGVDKAGTKLYLLVVDGRDADRSVGMSYSELSQQMLKLGAYHAINLDGGGSTTLVMRDPSNGELHVLNQPSDHRERPVANVLGIRLHPTTQPTR